MTIKIIAGLLILITASFSIKHGWAGVSNTMKPEEAKLFSDMGFTKSMQMMISVLSLAVGLLIFFPPTFFIANAVNAATILFIMIMALRSGNVKMALIEIPFLLMPLVLIYLGHPFKK